MVDSVTCISKLVFAGEIFSLFLVFSEDFPSRHSHMYFSFAKPFSIVFYNSRMSLFHLPFELKFVSFFFFL